MAAQTIHHYSEFWVNAFRYYFDVVARVVTLSLDFEVNQIIITIADSHCWAWKVEWDLLDRDQKIG